MKSEILKPKNGKDIYNDIQNAKNSTHWFAAANSKDGFVSFFDEIFGGDDTKNLYILGGGPGSGKSTLLKSVAIKAVGKGYASELYHCSSSPYSLDGVRIPEIGVSVIDGTSPHTYAAKLAGVRDHTVDLGKCWDKRKLSEHKEKIVSLSQEKSKMYRRATIYTAAAGKLMGDKELMVSPYILTEKLDKSICSLIDKEFLHKKYRKDECRQSVRIQSANSSDGKVYFDTFALLASKSYLVTDVRGIASVFMSRLLDMAKHYIDVCYVSYSPFDITKIDGLYFPKYDISFSVFAENPYKIINTERFLDLRALQNVRQKYNFADKSANALMLEAYSALYKAGELHEQIEQEYSPCTDYSAVQEMTQAIIKEIF